MKHTQLTIRRAKGLFELTKMKPQQISKKLKVPLRTVQYWIAENNWKVIDESPESIAINEYKRLIAKGDYSETDLRKLMNLRGILDEYTNYRSLFSREIKEAIDMLKSNQRDKDQVLNYLIRIVNRHTGAGIRQKHH